MWNHAQFPKMKRTDFRRNKFTPAHVKSERMKQADKGDKSHLTFDLSTSDDEKIIEVIDHGHEHRGEPS